jgi:hypothetical protein
MFAMVEMMQFHRGLCRGAVEAGVIAKALGDSYGFGAGKCL